MFAKQYSKPYHASQEAQHKRSTNTLIGVSVQLSYYKLSCDKLALHSRPFESVEFCLNRACTTLAILTFRELHDILQKASRELLALQYQPTSVVRVQSMGLLTGASRWTANKNIPIFYNYNGPMYKLSECSCLGQRWTKPIG